MNPRQTRHQIVAGHWPPGGSLAKAEPLLFAFAVCMCAVREELMTWGVVERGCVCATEAKCRRTPAANENHRHRASNSMCNNACTGWLGMTHMVVLICEVEAGCQTRVPPLSSIGFLLVQAEYRMHGVQKVRARCSRYVLYAALSQRTTVPTSKMTPRCQVARRNVMTAGT
ncbi:hypothetical protein V8C26DRAFT_398828 [Trichoderma gracile]